MTSWEALPIEVTGMMFVRPQLSAPMKEKMKAKRMARMVWPTERLNWMPIITHVKIRLSTIICQYDIYLRWGDRNMRRYSPIPPPHIHTGTSSSGRHGSSMAFASS